MDKKSNKPTSRKHSLGAIALAVFLAASLAPQQAGAAKKWIDVTEQYLVNPDFDNNSSYGWTWQSNAHSQTLRCNAMEFWNGVWDLWQVVQELPAGQYRLKVKAYYRCGEHSPSYDNYRNGSEQIPATMYAGSDQQTLASIYSYNFPANSVPDGCWTYWDFFTMQAVYFPNTMESGTEAFARGAYENQMEFTHRGGSLQFGLRNETWAQSNWCLFDNFRLEYYGEEVLATQLTVEPTATTLVRGETCQASARLAPDNVTYKTLSWTSANTSVATVDASGLITAVSTGTTRITARTTDGSNLSATIAVTVESGEAGKGAFVVNEVMASNVDEFISPAYNFDGWVELYNTTDRAVELGGIYVSDDAANLRKWHTPVNMGVLPANGYAVIWFDSNDLRQQNAPFKLDVDGGTLYFSNASGTLVAQQDYPASLERVSYARTTDGGSTWATTAQPTPGASNATSTFLSMQLAAPTVNQPSQLFTGSLVVSVDIPAGCTLRYTTDGTLPTLSNGQTSRSGQFNVTSTSMYRFRLFASDYLPSPTTTRSFIYRDRDYSLPVVSVVSDPAFLYDNEIGVYVRGTNGRPGNGQADKCNWNMNWERPVNFSYLDASGEMVLNQDVNLEMCGGWSRAWEPHSFKLKGNKELGGSKKLAYPFFAAKPYINNRTLQIRNGGNDTQCRIKDPALATIVHTSGLDVDLQSYQPVHEFVNGQYIGVLNVREPNNKHYVYANYGWDDEEIDQFEISPDSFYVQKCGTEESYQQLLSLSAYAADQGIYKEILQLLDVDEYLNYMATCFYLGGSDWTRNNVKAFRHRDGGRFRFVLFDTDGAFSLGSDVFNWYLGLEKNYAFDILYPSYTRIYADNTLVTIFRQLLQNSDFRRRFIDTYCVVAGSVFEENRAIQIIDELTDAVAPAMSLNGTSPYSTANSMKNSLRGRELTMINALRNSSLFALQSATAQSVTLGSDTDGARIEVNGVNIPTGSFQGHLFQPVTLRAVAPAGYVFQGWSNAVGKQERVFNTGATWQYYDQGSLDGTSWTANNYSTSGWKSGRAPLGYGMSGIATTISYGNNSSQKRPTYYFRRTFSLAKKPADNAVFMLNYYADDGFIVYVNGQEAGRYNMPSGSVSYNTYTPTWAGSTPDEGTLQLRGSLFREGSNVIAVEVHNISATSSDIYWDCSLTGDLGNGNDAAYYATTPELQLPEGSVQLTACYRPMTAAERLAEGMHAVRINEVSAANSVFVNEYGKKNDWLELVNTTAEEQDVEGMFLTDDLAQLKKYQISKEGTGTVTTIAPRGKLVVWCDKLETTRQALHASFKLAAEGGVVALSAADMSWTNTLRYDAHDGNHTVGRYPDGANDIFLMNVPTIAKANTLSSYDEAVSQTALAIKPAAEVASSGSLRIGYANQTLVLRSEDAAFARIDIITASGQLVETATANFHSGRTQLSVSHLQPGIYVARAIDSEGHRVSCKVVKP